MIKTQLWATMSGPHSHLADAPLMIIDEQHVEDGTVVEVREIIRQRSDEAWLATEMMMYGADALLERAGYRRTGDWQHTTTLTWVTEVQPIETRNAMSIYGTATVTLPGAHGEPSLTVCDLAGNEQVLYDFGAFDDYHQSLTGATDLLRDNGWRPADPDHVWRQVDGDPQRYSTAVEAI